MVPGFEPVALGDGGDGDAVAFQHFILQTLVAVVAGGRVHGELGLGHAGVQVQRSILLPAADFPDGLGEALDHIQILTQVGQKVDMLGEGGKVVGFVQGVRMDDSRVMLFLQALEAAGDLGHEGVVHKPHQAGKGLPEDEHAGLQHLDDFFLDQLGDNILVVGHVHPVLEQDVLLKAEIPLGKAFHQPFGPFLDNSIAQR
ncbi:hypothetical protein D3C75_689130 [compost metagenome]